MATPDDAAIPVRSSKYGSRHGDNRSIPQPERRASKPPRHWWRSRGARLGFFRQRANRSRPEIFGERLLHVAHGLERFRILETSGQLRRIGDLLDPLSRDQGLRLEPTDVNERLSSLRDLLRRLLPETIEIDLILGAHLPLVEGDQSQLDKVFMNLCINARDAMPGENLAELIRDSGVEFLRKPFDPEGLLRTIRRVLDGV